MSSRETALITIGGGNPQLEEEALAVARAIGKVIVDHGKTNCKTPDVATSIGKMKVRQKAEVGPA